MMTYSGRLIHLKVVISALPIFAMCCIRVPFTILDHFEKSGRGCLWYGKGINKHGKCLVKWDTVCLPKKARGLGVLDLRAQNRAMLTKFLFKFFNKHDTTWVQLIWHTYYNNGQIPSFPTKVGSQQWRDCCSILDDFRKMTICYPGIGDTMRLWKDRWADECLFSKFPQLFSYAKDKDITIATAKNIAHEEL